VWRLSFTSVERDPDTLLVGGQVGPLSRSGCGGIEKHAPAGNRTPAVQPVASLSCLVGGREVYSELCNTIFILALFVMILGDYK
jgi:hypothetical protein